MRAHNIITMSRRSRQRRRRALALAIGVCALAIPSTASGYSTTSGYSPSGAESGASNDSSQADGGSGYSSVTSIAPPASEPAARASIRLLVAERDYRTAPPDADVRLGLAERLGRRVRLGQRHGRRGCVAGARRPRRRRAAHRAQARP